MSLSHRLAHLFGWQRGVIVATERGGHQLVGFRCVTCGELAKPLAHSVYCDCTAARRFRELHREADWLSKAALPRTEPLPAEEEPPW